MISQCKIMTKVRTLIKKDISKLHLKELIGSLMTHEITMQDHDQGKDVKNKISIALKSSILQDSDSEEE